MKVLVACEESQEVCKAFRALGHEAYSCDIQEPSGGHPEWHILGDALKAIEGGQVTTMDGQTHDVGRWDMIIAFPPCTKTSNAGARHLYRGGKLNIKRYYRRNREDLRAYKATGLTPERCAEFARADAEGRYIVMRDAEQEGVARLRELAEADKDGRLVVLPCKVGDTVYFALLGKIIEKQVFSIVAFSNSTRIYCGGTSEYFRPEDIGKTFFLTREEAEKALEAMKNE